MHFLQFISDVIKCVPKCLKNIQFNIFGKWNNKNSVRIQLVNTPSIYIYFLLWKQNVRFKLIQPKNITPMYLQLCNNVHIPLWLRTCTNSYKHHISTWCRDTPDTWCLQCFQQCLLSKISKNSVMITGESFFEKSDGNFRFFVKNASQLLV